MAPRQTKIPRTVGALVDLLAQYPRNLRLSDYTIEVKTKHPAISEYVASWDSFAKEGEAWLPELSATAEEAP